MTNPFDDGASRRDEALDAHEANHSQKLLIVQHQFAKVLLSHASLNEVSLTPDFKGKYLGSVHRPFRRWIEESRLVKSADPKAHARRIIDWKLIDGDAVRNWLTVHPLPPVAPTCDTA